MIKKGLNMILYSINLINHDRQRNKANYRRIHGRIRCALLGLDDLKDIAKSIVEEEPLNVWDEDDRVVIYVEFRRDWVPIPFDIKKFRALVRLYRLAKSEEEDDAYILEGEAHTSFLKTFQDDSLLDSKLFAALNEQIAKIDEELDRLKALF